MTSAAARRDVITDSPGCRRIAWAVRGPEGGTASRLRGAVSDFMAG
eukprot:CAMPEP_0113299000 /NCGR_PEP_ID=MMETSP0010_2-20120614/1211_1 /TAXON_ID=216773 ORGANISM="Corethron hystrix, Strain 308" /NCGR_SAMPLE_ID=MMETSP0010_2 /ASSEMBLY_ACC=CAM_ASM_000155 /LENGTH=45 /DNA_ID=CAMNT_0000152149 /DNA_START=430 /DNA_END=563 /DNA_ORIENTATION=+ /assembly_acc=CAM_ASM_000155